MAKRKPKFNPQRGETFTLDEVIAEQTSDYECRRWIVGNRQYEQPFFIYAQRSEQHFHGYHVDDLPHIVPCNSCGGVGGNHVVRTWLKETKVKCNGGPSFSWHGVTRWKREIYREISEAEAHRLIREHCEHVGTNPEDRLAYFKRIAERVVWDIQADRRDGRAAPSPGKTRSVSGHASSSSGRRKVSRRKSGG